MNDEQKPKHHRLGHRRSQQVQNAGFRAETRPPATAAGQASVIATTIQAMAPEAIANETTEIEVADKPVR